MGIRYSPSPPPSNPEELSAYLSREFQRMSEVITNIADGSYDVTNVAPSKPRQGDVRFADGSNWNLGSCSITEHDNEAACVGAAPAGEWTSSGEGLYIYLSTGSWSKL